MASKKSKSKKTSKKYYYAKGRRKKSTATVRVFKGKGESKINDEKADDVYKTPRERKQLYSSFLQTDTKGKYHFTAKVQGGGRMGQLDAIKLALARAMEKVDPDFRKPLKDAGLLSVDDRVKERKKPGRKKARKKQQFSKR